MTRFELFRYEFDRGFDNGSLWLGAAVSAGLVALVRERFPAAAAVTGIVSTVVVASLVRGARRAAADERWLRRTTADEASAEEIDEMIAELQRRRVHAPRRSG